MSKIWMEKVVKVVRVWGGKLGDDDSNVKDFVNRMDEVVTLRN